MDVTDRLIACQLAAVLDALHNQSSARTVASTIARLYDGATGIEPHFTDGGLGLRWVKWEIFGERVIAIDGVQTWEQLRAFVDASAEAPSKAGWNQQALSWASHIFTSLRERAANVSFTTIVGHSGGGAAAYPLLSLLRNVGVEASSSAILAMGSPRSGTRDALQLVSFSKSVRYCVAGDPICAFPFRQEDSLIAWLSQGAQGAARASLWVHPEKATILLADGSTYDSFASAFPDALLLAAGLTQYLWLSTRDNEHNVREYRRRLVLSRTDVPLSDRAEGTDLILSGVAVSEPQAFVAQPLPEVVPFEPDGANATIEFTAASDEIRRWAQSQTNARGGYMPLVLGQPCKATVFKRSADEWVVSLVGRDVYVGEARSRANAVKRALNKFLRSMLSLNGTASVGDMSTAVGVVMALMSRPEGKCIPPLPVA